MNELQLFTNEKFGTIRTVTIENKTWFCGSDIAKALGYARPNDALRQHCKGATAKHSIIDSLGREQQATFISEGDVYRLITRSQLPQAVEFESWVFDEVLPTIQKHGMYITDNVWSDMMNDPLKFAELLTAYGNERKAKEEALRLAEEKQRVIEEQAPKVKFHDDMEISETSVLVRSLANIYKEKGVKLIIVNGVKAKLGEKKLREWFKERGYMNKSSYASEKNRPTQRAVDLGVMEERISTRTSGDDTYTNYTTYITSKGIKYFMDKIVKEVENYAEELDA